MCVRAAARAGAAAEEAALGKERSWVAQAEVQGETFYRSLSKRAVPLTNTFASFS